MADCVGMGRTSSEAEPDLILSLNMLATCYFTNLEGGIGTNQVGVVSQELSQASHHFASRAVKQAEPMSPGNK